MLSCMGWIMRLHTEFIMPEGELNTVPFCRVSVLHSLYRHDMT